MKQTTGKPKLSLRDRRINFAQRMVDYALTKIEDPDTSDSEREMLRQDLPNRIADLESAKSSPNGWDTTDKAALIAYGDYCAEFGSRKLVKSLLRTVMAQSGGNLEVFEDELERVIASIRTLAEGVKEEVIPGPFGTLHEQANRQ